MCLHTTILTSVTYDKKKEIGVSRSRENMIDTNLVIFDNLIFLYDDAIWMFYGCYTQTHTHIHTVSIHA